MTKTETKSTVLLEASPEAVAAADRPGRVREGRRPLCHRERRPPGFLLQLCELELIERERKAADRRLKAARFPATKTLDGFDFTARPSLNKPLVLDLVPRRLPRPPGEHFAGRPQRHGEDALGPGAGVSPPVARAGGFASCGSPN